MKNISTEPAENGVFAPFWQSAQRGVIAFPHCEDCDRFHWYPMPLCPHCRSGNISWRAVSGDGEVFSHTVVHHAYQKELAAWTPYIVALVTFEDAPGVRLVTNILGVSPEDVEIGMKVVPAIEEGGQGQARVCFRPAAIQ